MKKEKDKEKEKEVKTSSKKVTRTTPYLDLGRILLFVLKKNMDEVERRKNGSEPFKPSDQNLNSHLLPHSFPTEVVGRS